MPSFASGNGVLHGLGQHMRSGVPQHREALGRVDA